ncbi:hypothetical protein LEP1GSC016_1053 [Leptospira borgpetersenii serovar Hardjo-bovis str. Sponselee]|uniref:Uncharacterized protein n=2 Tax=Leptospira borgpetersenii TaxID=174 RepID=M6CBP0_LEPBO|nr:hypothetical protein LEP1GSC016_1053 [Leptospira borgpetersenii serovar Hardjo-bovis str. Sponselee]EMO08878.1 hypothetical protein LEP1GSC137_4273 [Leptospira borgpetersenii str. Noumea 25]EMO65105.1 hypothetical protein LEP1GSC133_0739 [Leptospira borgpetersenii serovar Pomona str. 200901868]
MRQSPESKQKNFPERGMRGVTFARKKPPPSFLFQFLS